MSNLRDSETFTPRYEERASDGLYYIGIMGVPRDEGLPPVGIAEAEAGRHTALRRAINPFMLPAAVDGISIDSRSIAPGEAFFAIKGDTHDGHGFVAAAVNNGAGVAVVAQDKRGEVPADAPLLVVPDVLAALGDLAAAARARSEGKIIAVRRMPRSPRSTITGACRSRSRACRRAHAMACSRSA